MRKYYYNEMRCLLPWSHDFSTMLSSVQPARMITFDQQLSPYKSLKFQRVRGIHRASRGYCLDMVNVAS